MTVNKTASSNRHGNTDYMPCHNKHQDMTPHLMPQNDNGHIHWASPIHGLPQESLINNITMASQHILDGITQPQQQRSHKQLKYKDKQQNQQWTTETTPRNGEVLPREVEHLSITTRPTNQWGHDLSPKNQIQYVSSFKMSVGLTSIQEGPSN